VAGENRGKRGRRRGRNGRDIAAAATEFASNRDPDAPQDDVTVAPGQGFGRHAGAVHKAGETPRAAGTVGAMSPEAQLIRELHAEHGAALSHFVTGLVGGDEVRAQDVVQETFIRAWRNPTALRDGAGPARSWLFTVARRIAIDDWRSRSRRPETLTAEPPETARPDDVSAVADRQVVIDALRTLSRPHREVLLECYFRGSSVAEAAVRLGLPEGTVKSRTHYALHALRDALAEMGGLA
jgi:RNA polymerase sigma-70 factor (ECF subfamily)